MVDDHQTWCRVVNYNEGNSPRMSDDSLSLRDHVKSCDKMRTCYLSLRKVCDRQKWEVVDL